MLRVAICEDVLSELQKQTQIIQSIMARLSKNVKFFCFRSGEELLMETDTTGNMDIVFLDVEMLRFLYKGIIIKHNKTEPTYTKTSLFLCEKRRFFMARTEKGVVTTI